MHVPRVPRMLIAALLLVVPAGPAQATTSLGSLDCDRSDAALWRDSVGPVFGQGYGTGYSFSAGGSCVSRLTQALPTQGIRLATLGPNGYTGIPLVAAEPEVSLDVSTSVRPADAVGSAQYVYVLLRKQYGSGSSNGHEYRARITISARTSAGRNVRLKLSRVVSSVETPIGTGVIVPTTQALYEPDRVLHVRVAATGAAPTTLRAKVWSEGVAEPDWQVQETDADPALQDAGRIELLTKVSAANTALPVDVRFDNLEFADAG